MGKIMGRSTGGDQEHGAPSDLLLVQRVQKGEKGAFDLLVRKYQHKVISLVGRFVRSPEEAEDVAQEAFVKAYRALANFRGDSAFYTWLYRIAVNTAKNHLVAQGRQVSTVADLEGQVRLPDRPRQTPGRSPGRSPGRPATAAQRTDISTLRHNLQASMWQAAGIVRNDEGLRAACAYWDEQGARIGDSQCGPQPYQELRNLYQCAEILTCAALLREESRGCHFNSDHPQRLAIAADSISQRDRQSPFLRPIPGAA